MPDQGRPCSVVIDGKIPRQRFYDSIEDLARSVLILDGKVGQHGAVYFACATFDQTGRRRQENVVRVRSLWLDVDAGDGHAYASPAEALLAIRAFVDVAALPIPTLVASGAGIHAYWPLASSFDRVSWQLYANGLKAKCVALGLHADPARTADAASILRPPGTYHRKGEPRLVICGPLQGPYELELFGGLISERPDVSNQSLASDKRGADVFLGVGHRRGSTSLLNRALNTFAPETIDFDALLTGCAQMRHFMETRGNVPEPLWYALIGVLAWVGGGDDKAQEWSAGHPTYSSHETNNRLVRARGLSGPTTCGKIGSLGPLCAGCRFGSGTPLQAARESTAPNSIFPASSDGDPPPEGAADALLHGEFHLKEGGLYHRSEDSRGHAVWDKITSYPVEIKSIHSGEIKKDQHSYLIRYHRPHEGWREIDLLAGALFGPATIATMAELGIVIYNYELFKLYVRESVDRLTGKEKTKMSYEQFGWKDGFGSFLYGDRLYTAKGYATTAVSRELRFRAHWLQPTPGGSVEGWRLAADNLMGRGSEGMSLTILASFAAPLMKMLEDNEGGAVLHLMTTHSGAGKTTALAGAYTVWASDPRAISLTSIDTKVTKAVALGAMCNLPVVFDEFEHKDPSVIREQIVTFTSGRDKMRANQSGNIQHTAASWQTLLLSAANKSLSELITSTGESDAPTYRILEFPVESSGQLKPSEAMRYKKMLEENAGHAGEAFLTYLLDPAVMAWAREHLSVLIDDIFEQGKFRKEHRFWVRALAACGTAAVLVQKLDLIAFDPKRVMDWAIKLFAERVHGLTADASQLHRFSRFLNEMIGETLIMPGPSHGRKAQAPIGDKPRQKVSVRSEVEGGRIYVSEWAFREWVARKGGGYEAILDELHKGGVLLDRRKAVTLTAGTEIRSGVTTCFVVDGDNRRLTGAIEDVMGGNVTPLQQARRALEERRAREVPSEKVF